MKFKAHRKLIGEMKVLLEALLSSMEESYVLLFKGALLLFGLSLAGLTQSYPEITKFDYDARKIQFEVEAEAKKSLKEIDCNALERKQADCNLVKYQLGSNKYAMSLASFIITVCGYLGLLLMCLSLHGYILKSLAKHRGST